LTPEAPTNEQMSVGKYEDCIIAFLDILGFKNKVLDSETKPEILEKIIQSSKIVNAITAENLKMSGDSTEQRAIQIRGRFFSDSLVFFLRKNPSDITELFFIIRFIQDQLWERDICLRGSVVIGQMYWSESDDKITVGTGLINAYRCESKVAIYPRIVVSDDLYDYILGKRIPAKPFGNNATENLTGFIHQDADGVHFLDLLNPGITRTEGERLDPNTGSDWFSILHYPNATSQHPEVLGYVDRINRSNIENEDMKVRQKYAWLKTYRERYNG
jgi:hypothetical protein